MRSFRDRNPYLVGLVSVAILGLLVALAFAVGLLKILEDTYNVKAVFSDASGIRRDNDVKVAGVKAGRVTGVKADRENGNVIVTMVVNSGVRLGPQTKAEIALGTLLGAKFVRLSGTVEPPYLHEEPEEQRVIPIERTKTPFDVFELVKVGTRNIEATNTDQLNLLVNQLANVTEGKHEQIAQLLEGLNRFSTQIAERDQQLRELLERADRLSATLAEKDHTIVSLLDQSQAVLDLVSRRRADIARGLRSTDVAVTQVAGVLAAHKSQVDLLLETLHPTLDILDRRQADLDRALAWLGPGSFGLGRAAAHGPWADVYVRSIGPGLIPLLESLTGSDQ